MPKPPNGGRIMCIASATKLAQLQRLMPSPLECTLHGQIDYQRNYELTKPPTSQKSPLPLPSSNRARVKHRATPAKTPRPTKAKTRSSPQRPLPPTHSNNNCARVPAGHPILAENILDTRQHNFQTRRRATANLQTCSTPPANAPTVRQSRNCHHSYAHRARLQTQNNRRRSQNAP